MTGKSASIGACKCPPVSHNGQFQHHRYVDLQMSMIDLLLIRFAQLSSQPSKYGLYYVHVCVYIHTASCRPSNIVNSRLRMVPRR